MAKKKATTVSVKDRLRALYQLQMIDSEIDKIRSVRGELPLEIEDLEEPEMIEKILRREGYGKEGDKLIKVHFNGLINLLKVLHISEIKKSKNNISLLVRLCSCFFILLLR